jgi:hypothetical protein
LKKKEKKRKKKKKNKCFGGGGVGRTGAPWVALLLFCVRAGWGRGVPASAPVFTGSRAWSKPPHPTPPLQYCFLLLVVVVCFGFCGLCDVLSQFADECYSQSFWFSSSSGVPLCYLPGGLRVSVFLLLVWAAGGLGDVFFDSCSYSRSLCRV